MSYTKPSITIEDPVDGKDEEVIQTPCDVPTSAKGFLHSHFTGRSPSASSGNFPATPDTKHQGSFGGFTSKAKKKNQPKVIFPDAEEMKRQARAGLGKKVYNVMDFYYDTGFFQAVARDPRFEKVTLTVIVINALYMAVDADLNTAAQLSEAHAVFQICENLFCTYFTGELVFRFGSFRNKCNCMKDAWFVFDSVLVTTMVLETWLMSYIFPLVGLSLTSGPMGNTGILRLLRLARLSRMSRMAKLLRSVPELMILLKGMKEASSSCMWTSLLLVIAMYVWSLALKMLSEGTEFAKIYFPNVPEGMYNLMITGCFMKTFDIQMNLMKEESLPCFFLYFLFVLFAGVTIMKMLTGMLCKVINAIAVSETEKMLVAFAQDELLEVLIEMGVSDAPDIHHVDFEDLFISQEIFAEMMSNERAVAAFRRIGVDCIGLCASADFIFPELDEAEGDKEHENWSHVHEHKRVPFADFMDSILQLRGSQTATVKDMVDIRKFVRHELLQVEHNLSLAVNHQCSRVLKGLGAKVGGRTAMNFGKGVDLQKRGGALADYGGSDGSHGKDPIAKEMEPDTASKDNECKEEEEAEVNVPEVSGMFALAHRTKSQRNSLTFARSDSESEPVKIIEPDALDEPVAEEKEPWKSENSTDGHGGTADLVFQCFCELDEAERARFFALMACGSSQGVPPGRGSSASIRMSSYRSDRDSLVLEPPPDRDGLVLEPPPGRALASNGIHAAILHARRASGEARSDPQFFLRSANQLPGPNKAVGDRAVDSPSDSAGGGSPNKAAL